MKFLISKVNLTASVSFVGGGYTTGAARKVSIGVTKDVRKSSSFVALSERVRNQNAPSASGMSFTVVGLLRLWR